MPTYRLLCGKHTEPTGVFDKGIELCSEMKAGDTITTDKDLCAIWNKGGEVRFELVEEKQK